MSTICRYVEGWGYYLPSHEASCRDNTCDGCEPCTERHCTAGTPTRACTSHLEPGVRLTCPRCVGRTRRDIADIAGWYAVDLPEEAIEGGVDSEAANLSGPAADPIIAHWRRHNEFRATGTHGPETYEGDDGHPLDVLGGYEMRLREDYKQDYSELPRITVAGAARYLTAILDTLAQDPEQDWPQFAAEIATCRSHLAAVLHLLRRNESGAPCPACEKAPPLRKRWFPHQHPADWNPEDECKGCDLGDTWHCPACGSAWNEVDYRRWVADDYRLNADALTIVDLAMIHNIPAGTIRRWAAKVDGEEPRIKPVGRDASGRNLYRVAEVKALREGAGV